MKVEFNPLDPAEREMVLILLGEADPAPAPAHDTPPMSQPQTTGGVQLDEGNPPLPWDERINTKHMAKREGDGRWKMKPGISKDTYSQVIAELTAQAQEVTPPAEPVAPVTPPAEPVAPAPPRPITFAEFMQKVPDAAPEAIEAEFAKYGKTWANAHSLSGDELGLIAANVFAS